MKRKMVAKGITVSIRPNFIVSIVRLLDVPVGLLVLRSEGRVALCGGYVALSDNEIVEQCAHYREKDDHRAPERLSDAGDLAHGHVNHGPPDGDEHEDEGEGDDCQHQTELERFHD
jgi:hypothetical protein